MSLRPAPVLGLLALLLGLAACAGRGSQSATLTARDIFFVEPTVTVRSGQTITLTFTNVGTLEHSMIIDLPPLGSPDGDVGVPSTWRETPRGVPADQSAALTFTAPAPGEYKIYCHMPGHDEMVSKLIVK